MATDADRCRGVGARSRHLVPVAEYGVRIAHDAVIAGAGPNRRAQRCLVGEGRLSEVADPAAHKALGLLLPVALDEVGNKNPVVDER